MLSESDIFSKFVKDDSKDDVSVLLSYALYRRKLSSAIKDLPEGSDIGVVVTLYLTDESVSEFKKQSSEMLVDIVEDWARNNSLAITRTIIGKISGIAGKYVLNGVVRFIGGMVVRGLDKLYSAFALLVMMFLAKIILESYSIDPIGAIIKAIVNK